MDTKPLCVIVTGRPGSGKTTLSKELGRILWMPVVSRDELKEGFVNTFGVRTDQLPADSNGRVSALFFEIVHRLLDGSVSVIIEAAFQHDVWASQISELRMLAHPVAIRCALDSQLAASRHLQRGLENPCREHYHGDARVGIYRRTGVVAPPGGYIEPALGIPTLHVCTQNGYAPPLSEIASALRSMPRASD